MDKIVVAEITKPSYGILAQWKEIVSPEGIAPTLLAAVSGSEEHSIKVVEMKFEDYQISQKGVNYVLHPKRGKFSRINPDIGCTVTTHMGEWVGNFISIDIEKIERPEAMIGSITPTLIYQKDGTIVSYDGKDYKVGVKCTGTEVKVLEEIKCIQAGELHGQYDKMFEQSRRVYDPNVAAPTQHTVGGGNLECKIIQEPKLLGGIGDVNWGKQYHQQDRIYDSEAVAMACCAGMPGGSYMYGIEEPQAMKLTRTEEGKAMRREKGDDNMAFKEGKELLPRDDGLLNTLTTVDKDNYVAIPIKSAVKKGYEEAYPGDCVDIQFPNSDNRRGRVGTGVSQTLQTGGENQMATVMPNYRIRKLTEKECFRLMGVIDEDSANIAKNQSKSSQYHLAGDSIVTACLMAIFGEMLDMDWETKIRELEESICHESNS